MAAHLVSCCCQSQAHILGIDEEYEMDSPRQRGQWLVSARLDGVLSIMTPVYPDDENLSLLLNQVCGLSAFCRFCDRLVVSICRLLHSVVCTAFVCPKQGWSMPHVAEQHPLLPCSCGAQTSS